MIYNRKVNPCQPGYGASCALCCGSHNYRMDREEIEALFIERGITGPRRPYRHQYEVTEEKLYRDAMQCSHVAICSGEEVCCIIYNEQDMKGDVLSFFNGTCRNFYCQAWDDLTDSQVIFAARLMQDWFYYSLFINDIEAVQNIFAAYESPDDIPDDELEKLKEELLERFIEEDGK